MVERAKRLRTQALAGRSYDRLHEFTTRVLVRDEWPPVTPSPAAPEPAAPSPHAAGPAALLPALAAAGVAIALFDAAGRLTAATPAVRRALADDPEWNTVWQTARAAALALHDPERPDAVDVADVAGPSPLLCEREVQTGAAVYRLVVSAPGGAQPAWAAVIFDRRCASPPSDEPSAALGGLSARERQVARLLAAGRTTAAVGAALRISAHTARRHAERVYSKLGVRNRAALGALLARDDAAPA